MQIGEMRAEASGRLIRTKTSALFVDFDNIYIGLTKLGAEVAEAFATRPQDWLGLLAEGEDEYGPYRRRFLVRSCYLNPNAFSRFRVFFTNVGFAVIDCPSLTQQGKSSADIHMVLGALDALASPVKYEEFVVLASDADYTPIATRIRAADRRVTVVTSGPAAAAYRAIADHVLASEILMERLPGSEAGEFSYTTAVTPQTAMKPEAHVEGVGTVAGEAVQAVTDAMTQSPGYMRPARVGDIALEAEPALSADWGGHLQFRRWLESELPELRFMMEPPPGWVIDPQRVDPQDLPKSSRPQLTVLQQQVVTVTDVPPLTKPEFEALHRALASDAQAHEFLRNPTAKRVRNELQRQELPVNRAAVNFVITGLLYAGFGFGPETTAEDVATSWSNNVLGRCRARRLELTTQDELDIRDWVGGGLARPVDDS